MPWVTLPPVTLDGRRQSACPVGIEMEARDGYDEGWTACMANFERNFSNG